jgi:hypothetical protein
LSGSSSKAASSSSRRRPISSSKSSSSAALQAMLRAWVGPTAPVVLQRVAGAPRHVAQVRMLG